ncbi:hypothetical protein [Saccharibacillus endophyticus]|uniref:Uncharacterized protein n=1 Tax=Saccharibacillus endophyticus TaxID=2060666 RepID=A0ABQ1ZSC0_9BACL|nr:hypothetical protein [Saccharibacillus endophyticus]GGH78107.1 hypothetical protein GCM10007362_22890 [Saccharibacillus endophyticus]
MHARKKKLGVKDSAELVMRIFPNGKAKTALGAEASEVAAFAGFSALYKVNGVPCCKKCKIIGIFG